MFWALALQGGIKYLQGSLEARKKNKQADREYQRSLWAHEIEEMAIKSKWANSAIDKSIISDRKKNEAMDANIQDQAELNELKKSTVNTIRTLNVEYLKGGYSEQTGRRGGLKTVNREVLLKQTEDRNKLALALTGKETQAQLRKRINERKMNQADHDWDVSVNAARPGGRHLPPHPGYVSGPNPLEIALDIGGGLLAQNTNRDSLSRRQDSGPYTD